MGEEGFDPLSPPHPPPLQPAEYVGEETPARTNGLSQQWLRLSFSWPGYHLAKVFQQILLINRSLVEPCFCKVVARLGEKFEERVLDTLAM